MGLHRHILHNFNTLVGGLQALPRSFYVVVLMMFCAPKRLQAQATGPVFDPAKNASKNSLRQLAEKEISQQQESVAPKENLSSSGKTTDDAAFLIARPENLEKKNTGSKWYASIGLENLSPQGELRVAELDPIALNGFQNQAAVILRLNWWAYQSAKSRWGLSTDFAWQQRSYNLQNPGTSDIHLTKLDLLRPSLSINAAFPIQTWKSHYLLMGGVNLAAGQLYQIQSSATSNLLNVSSNVRYIESGANLSFYIHKSFFMDVAFKTRAGFNSNYERTYHGVFSAGLPL